MGGSLTFQSVDLTNKVAIVTGGNAGIGYETTKALAVMGAHTIIACRSEERATGVSMLCHNSNPALSYVMQVIMYSFIFCVGH